jgi:hypothetical protein
VQTPNLHLNLFTPFGVGWREDATAGLLLDENMAILDELGGGSVASIFGRVGVVVAQAGDYAAFYDTLGAAATALTNAEASAAGLYLPLAGGTMTGLLVVPTSDLLIKGATYGTTIGTQASANWTFKFPATAGTNLYVLQTDGSGNTSWVAQTGPSGGVTSVSNSDGTLTISPTTGAVVASLNLGHTNTWTVTQTINPTGAAFSILPSNSEFVVGNSGASSRVANLSFGSSAYFSGVAFGGTSAAPTAVTSGTEIGGFNAWAYNGVGLNGPIAALRMYANQNQAVGAGGSYVDITTTPNGSTTQAEVIRFNSDGGITVPSTVTGGDQGAGTINAGGLYVNGIAVSTTTISLRTNGTPNSSQNILNLNNTPAAPNGYTNVIFQSGSGGSVSGYVPIPTQVTVPFSATPVFNASLGTSFLMTLTGNVTSSTFTNGVKGQIYVFEIIGNGSATFAWPSTFYNAPIVNPAGGIQTTQAFYFDGTSGWALGVARHQYALSAAGIVNLSGDEWVNGVGGSSLKLTLTGNGTLSVSSPIPGQIYVFEIIQDATGDHTLTWPSNFQNPNPINTAPNSTTIASFYYDGTNFWNMGAPAPGVQSVFGRTGVVVAVNTDYSSVPNLELGDGAGNSIDFSSTGFNKGISITDYAGNTITLNGDNQSLTLTDVVGDTVVLNGGIYLLDTFGDSIFVGDDSIGFNNSAGDVINFQGGTFAMTSSSSGGLFFSDSGGTTITSDGAPGDLTLTAPTTLTLDSPVINVDGQVVQTSAGTICGQATLVALSTSISVTFPTAYAGTNPPIVVITEVTTGTPVAVTTGVQVAGSAGAWAGFAIKALSAPSSNVTFNYIVIGQS